MKRIIPTLLLILVCLQVFSQQTIADLTSATREASSDSLETIYDLNVFDYFNLENYDTELKRGQ